MFKEGLDQAAGIRKMTLLNLLELLLLRVEKAA